MKTISVSIGQKVFQVNCPENDEASLMVATEQIGRNFDRLREQAPKLAFDQTLLLAALNTVVFYHIQSQQMQENNHAAHTRLKALAKTLGEYSAQSNEQDPPLF